MNFTERRRRFPSIPNEVQIKFKSRKHFSPIRASEISGKVRTAGQEISVAEGVLRLADIRRVRADEEVPAHGEEGADHHRPLANPLRRLPRESLYAPRIFAHLYPFRFIHQPFRRWSRPSSLHHAATSYILDPIHLSPTLPVSAKIWYNLENFLCVLIVRCETSRSNDL